MNQIHVFLNNYPAVEKETVPISQVKTGISKASFFLITTMEIVPRENGNLNLVISILGSIQVLSVELDLEKVFLR